MAKSRTERVNALMSKLDKWDQQIEEITRAREEAVAEIGSLLGLGSAPAAKSGIKSQPAEKLGDRIVNILRSGDGLTRDSLSAKVKEAGQKVSLALYHLINRGTVYEMDGRYWLPAPTTDAPPAPPTA